MARACHSMVVKSRDPAQLIRTLPVQLFRTFPAQLIRTFPAQPIQTLSERRVQPAALFDERRKTNASSLAVRRTVLWGVSRE